MLINNDETKKYDLVAVGRACIDLNAVDYNRPMEETMTFAKYVGGSPANVAIGLAKLGLKPAFIGKLADDQHGRFIKTYMTTAGVQMDESVVDSAGHKTGLAFTEIKSPSDCSILMYRDEVADLYLEATEVSESAIKASRLLLVSGTALAASPSREAILTAVNYAKKHGVPIVFELDYRPYTWRSAVDTAVYYRLVANEADIIIGTRDEFDRLENHDGGENEATITDLFKQRAQLIVIKHGVEGSYAYTKAGEVFDGKVYRTKVLKTFGAGDSYAAAFIYALLEGKTIDTALKYGSAAAAIVVSQHSSSDAMPTVAAIEALIASHQP
ncbi:5-dehydro-2-deoxygluconokinase [Brochothrix campestris]|uniref:5-dehydro-2-deoxygluconokinase n=1 Tax=Brochothrix campestris FSL F6-1037 TaxID=1265861 RepID=W7D1V6_9LIST|nr:5-dehydro-2-deoxygluconokinase [Brochothrix campestris]EUJ41911.1 protein IolC [Brochothrix campestris FSL F6-1037]